MSFIGRSWRGEEPLWKVFWLYGVLLGVVIPAVLASIVESFDSAAMRWTMLAFYVVYQFWLYVSQWRCAFNASWSIWGYIIRILIAIYALMLVLGIGAIVIGASLSGINIVKVMTLGSTMKETSPECMEFIKRRPPKTDPEAQRIFDQQNAAQVEYCGKMVLRAMGMESVLKNFRDADGRPSDAPPVPPMTWPGDSVPAQENQKTGANEAARPVFRKMCIDEMEAHAVKNNVDPKQYISDNPQYLQDCIEYRMYNASNPQTPAKP